MEPWATSSNETASESFAVTVLRRWLPQAYFDEVVSVELYYDDQITDADVAQLEGLTGLQELWLFDTQVTDAGVAHFEGLTSTAKALRRRHSCHGCWAGPFERTDRACESLGLAETQSRMPGWPIWKD